MSDPRRRQGGFTLLEILIAIGVMAMIIAVLFPALDGMMKFGQKEETHARLVAAANALRLAYTNNAMTVDSYTGDELVLSAATGAAIQSAASATLSPGVVPDTTAYGAATAAALTQITQTQGIAPGRLDTDGFNKHFAFFVSDRLQSTAPGGVMLYYHVVAIVSAEGAATLPKGSSWNAATGVFTSVAGEQVATVSGLPIERSLLRRTMRTLQTIASAYGQFFTSQYLSSSNRSVAVDYFSTSAAPENGTNVDLFDADSPIGNSAGNLGGWGLPGTPYPGTASADLPGSTAMLTDCQPATSLSGFQATLGFSVAALQSAWGYPVAVCNGPAADGQGAGGFRSRNPAASDATMQTPPYTAAIEAWAPGNVVISVPVTGQY